MVYFDRPAVFSGLYLYACTTIFVVVIAIAFALFKLPSRYQPEDAHQAPTSRLDSLNEILT